MTPGSLHPVTPLFLPLRKSRPRGRHQSASLFLSTRSSNTYNLSGKGSGNFAKVPYKGRSRGVDGKMFVIPSFQTPPFCHSRPPPSVIPDRPPSVIPDVFNRESRGFFPYRGTRRKGQKRKTGFPLETCGNDRGEEAGMLAPDGSNRGTEGEEAGMAEGTPRA